MERSEFECFLATLAIKDSCNSSVCVLFSNGIVCVCSGVVPVLCSTLCSSAYRHGRSSFPFLCFFNQHVCASAFVNVHVLYLFSVFGIVLLVVSALMGLAFTPMLDQPRREQR